MGIDNIPLWGRRDKPLRDFNFTSALPTVLTYSRAGNATMFDATGTMVWAPANMLLDSYFANATITTNWRASVGSGGTAQISRVTTYANPYGGGAVARFTGSKIDDAISTVVAVKPQFVSGQSYTVSATVRGSGKVVAQYQIDAGTKKSGTEITLTDEWQTIYVTAIADITTAGNVRVALVSDNAVDCYVGTIKLEPTSYNSPQPYIPTTSAAYYGERRDCDPATLQPRGLLTERQSTNLCTRSWQIASWTNNNATSTTNSVYISPDGTKNAAEVVTNANNKGRYLIVAGLTAATFYAISGYVKSFSGSALIRVGPETTEGTVGNGMLIINTTTGAITGYGTKTYDRYSVLLPNGWTYFRYYIKTGAAQTSLAFVAASHEASGSTFSVWGAQVELGISATSHIPTYGAAATRAADVAPYATLSALGINPDEGTMIVDAMVPYSIPATRSYFAGMDDGTGNNVIATFIETDGKPIGGNAIGGVVTLSGDALAVTTPYTNISAVRTWKNADHQFKANNVIDGDGTMRATAVPVVTTFRIGGGIIANRELNGWVRRVRVWRTANINRS